MPKQKLEPEKKEQLNVRVSPDVFLALEYLQRHYAHKLGFSEPLKQFQVIELVIRAAAAKVGFKYMEKER